MSRKKEIKLQEDDFSVVDGKIKIESDELVDKIDNEVLSIDKEEEANSTCVNYGYDIGIR